jgi:hypothetical protein
MGALTRTCEGGTVIMPFKEYLALLDLVRKAPWYRRKWRFPQVFSGEVRERAIAEEFRREDRIRL